MRIGVFGTGIVGRTLATKCVELGHEVTMGSRTAENEAATAWAAAAEGTARVATFADAAGAAELLINATSGGASLAVIGSCAPASLDGKVLVDVANPLDFSAGFPPSLSTVNTDSLGEQIQAAHPTLRVVKTLNTVSAPVMTQPSMVPGRHNLFLCGNDAAAKAEVAGLLQSFGWPDEDILDLGDITMSRGVEMYLALWVRLFGVTGTPAFNIQVVKG